MSARDLERQISRARRAWNLALGVALLGRAAGPGLFAAGVSLLLARVSGHDGWPLALSLGLALTLALGLRGWLTRRVGPEQMATLLDLRLGGGGELLHAHETGAPLVLPAHTARPARPARPADAVHPAQLAHVARLTRPRPDGRAVARNLAPGLLFLAATLAVPVRVAPVERADLLAQQRIEELTELARTMEETATLDDTLRAEVEANLDSLRDAADDRELSGAALHEALDQVEQSLSERSREVADRLDALRREALQAGAELAGGADAGRRDELASELSSLARELADLGALPEGLSAADLAGLDPAELASKLDGAALDRLAKLAEKGLLDPRALARGGPPRKLTALPPLDRPEGDPGGT